MDTKKEFMDTKTKVFTAVIQVALDLAFIGYYFWLYNGNAHKVSSYTTSIILFGCCCSGFYNKKKLGNKFLDIWVKLNAVLLVIWGIIVVVQLFM